MVDELAKALISDAFFAEHGGQTSTEGRGQCRPEDSLLELNQGLRTGGGWFTEQQLFFTKAVSAVDDVPDSFYVDSHDSNPEPCATFV